MGKNRRVIRGVQVGFVVLIMAVLMGCNKEPERIVVDTGAVVGDEVELQQEEMKNNEGNVDTQEGDIQEGDTQEGDIDSADKEGIVLGEQILSEVDLSHSGGLYAESFSLELKIKEEGTIYYTTDGSNPLTSKTRLVYEEPIAITDRKNDENFLSGLDTSLYDGANVKVNSTRDGFVSSLRSKPSKEDVDKCTVIRVVVMDEQNNYSEVASHTYFIGNMIDHIPGIVESSDAAGKSLAIISLTMDYGDLFDEETGIYVKGKIFEEALADFLQNGEEKIESETARQLEANYKQRGREWERNVHVDFYESDGATTTRILSQDAGIRIQGNYSRSDLQKGFRLYARDSYGKKNFEYPIFGDELVNDQGETISKFKTLILRNGGNTAFTTKFSDTYWQTLITDMNGDTQTSRPCVVYLNGEYWGVYVLQEDYTEEYFENTHGVEKNDVVLYKGDAEKLELGYKLDLGELPQGESNESYYFEDLLAFFETHTDLKSEEDYEAFARLVDVDSARDYFAVQIWMNNKWDWPGKNWSMWKVTQVDDSNPYSDGRWRYVFYDVEFGGVMGKNEARTNTIKENNYEPAGMLDKGTENPSVLVFAYLMTNENFRNSFGDRILSLSENQFQVDHALEVLDQYRDTYGPLYDQFFSRYPETGSKDNSINGGYASYLCIKEFIEARPPYIAPMLKHVEDFYKD